MATQYENYTTLLGAAYYAVLEPSWYSQTFTPLTAHTLTSIKFNAFKNGSPGTITVAVKAVDGSSKPTGADLSTGTFNGNNLSATGHPGEWFEVTMSSVSLLASTEYALIVKALESGGVNYLSLRYNAAAGYSSGVTWFTDDGGSTWNATDQDMNFDEYGNPAFIPRVIII